MDVKTKEWLMRLPLWLYAVLRELPESGDAYLCEMLVPSIAGFMSLAVPGLLLLVIPEIRVLWPWVVLAGIAAYLLVGVATYFSWPSRSYGSWQDRGAW
jgi:hypothetical protein